MACYLRSIILIFYLGLAHQVDHLFVEVESAPLILAEVWKILALSALLMLEYQDPMKYN